MHNQVNRHRCHHRLWPGRDSFELFVGPLADIRFTGPAMGSPFGLMDPVAVEASCFYSSLWTHNEITVEILTDHAAIDLWLVWRVSCSMTTSRTHTIFSYSNQRLAHLLRPCYRRSKRPTTIKPCHLIDAFYRQPIRIGLHGR